MKATKAAKIGPKSLLTSKLSVQELQKSLHAKAKAEPKFRFYSLWDKICRKDVLDQAYQQCRRNKDAAGSDGVSFSHVESEGPQIWLGNLQEELRSRRYTPQPLLRVWIPKTNGEQRPLSIPTIRDKVVQTAVLLVVGSIFEADLAHQQYGFRPNLGPKMAVRRIFYHITQHGRREIVDADLKDYFGSIPHAPLMKSIARRIADSTLLAAIKQWLCCGVIERSRFRQKQTAETKRRKRGVAQGSPLSPLLANLYFRRFILAWEKFGHADRLNAHIVNFADDMVICCPLTKGAEAMYEMRTLMRRLGLTVNEEKTQITILPEDTFDFLGYAIGSFYGKDGR